uniref:Uncharacterized protein n=1 Tax=Anguilla anguilla TaxID=7936 RepID=A0A0E9VHX5_ANGAN
MYVVLHKKENMNKPAIAFWDSRCIHIILILFPF